MGSLQDRNKAIVRRFNEEFIQRGDLAVFEETVAADFVNHSAQPGMPSDAAGALHFFTQVLRPAFPDLEVTIHDQIAEGDKVVTRKSYTGTHQQAFLGVPATGRKVHFGVTDTFVLRNGQYVDHWTVADLFILMKQLTS